MERTRASFCPIEAFSPPYLFRGPRPEVSDLSTTTLRRGDSFTFRVAKTNSPTSVIAMGTMAVTHFMDSGNGRYLKLDFTQNGDVVTATVPTNKAQSVVGHYILYAMVDDIPSVGKMIRITL